MACICELCDELLSFVKENKQHDKTIVSCDELMSKLVSSDVL